MILLFLLPVLIFAENNIFDIVNNKLNKDVNPCDDFYEHVCSNQKTYTETFFGAREAKVNSSIAPYLSELHQKIQANYERKLEESSLITLSEEETANELEKRCTNDPAAFEDYLKIFSNIIKLHFKQNDCKEKANAVSTGILFVDSYSELYQVMKIIEFNLHSVATHVGQIIAYRDYNAHNPNFIDSYVRLYDLFVTFKHYMRTSIEASPRNRDNHYVEYFVKQLGKIELYDWNTPDVFSEPLSKFGVDLDRCLKSIVGHKMEVWICLVHSVQSEMSEIMNGPHWEMVKSGVDTNSAYINHTVYVYPAFTADDITDLPSTYLQFSPVYVHEMGHGIYWNESYIDDCLPERMNAANDLFCKGDCRSGEETKSEDAADWNAVRMLLDVADHLFKAYPGYIQTAKDRFNDKSLSLHQIIFYSFANTFCLNNNENRRHGYPIEPHSVHRLRVDGIFRMFPEFQRAFKCQKGDKMRAKQNESCALSGPGATRK